MSVQLSLLARTSPVTARQGEAVIKEAVEVGAARDVGHDSRIGPKDMVRQVRLRGPGCSESGGPAFKGSDSLKDAPRRGRMSSRLLRLNSPGRHRELGDRLLEEKALLGVSVFFKESDPLIARFTAHQTSRTP